MEFKNGHYEQLVKNTKDIQNLYQLRRECKSAFEKEFEDIKKEVDKVRESHKELQEKLNKKIDRFQWLLISVLTTTVFNLIILIVKMTHK